MTVSGASHHRAPLLRDSIAGLEDAKGVAAIAREELVELLQQRVIILKRITALRRMLSGLTEIFGEEVLGEELELVTNVLPRRRLSGLTAACRSVLMNSNHPLTVGEVVARVRSTDNDLLRNHKNAFASVTTILWRLQSYGETTSSLNPSGSHVWTWACLNSPQ